MASMSRTEILMLECPVTREEEFAELPTGTVRCLRPADSVVSCSHLGEEASRCGCCLDS